MESNAISSLAGSRSVLNFAIPANSKADDIIELSKDGKCSVSKVEASSKVGAGWVESPDQLRASEAVKSFIVGVGAKDGSYRPLTVARLQELQQQVGGIGQEAPAAAVQAERIPPSGAGFRQLEEWGADTSNLSKEHQDVFTILFAGHDKVSKHAGAMPEAQVMVDMLAMKELYLASCLDARLCSVLALHMVECSNALSEATHNLAHEQEAFPSAFVRLGSAEDAFDKEFEERYADTGKEVLRNFKAFSALGAVCDLHEKDPEGLKRFTQAMNGAKADGVEVPAGLPAEALVFASMVAVKDAEVAAGKEKEDRKREQDRIQEVAAATNRMTANLIDALKTFHSYKKDERDQAFRMHFDREPDESALSLPAGKADDIRSAVDGALETLARGGMQLGGPQTEMGKFVLAKK